MPELNLSQHFSIEDIHKIREYNYEMTKNMTTEERIAYYNNNAEIAENRIQEFKKTLYTKGMGRDIPEGSLLGNMG